MRQYELIFIVHPDLDATALDDTVKRVSNWITEESGEIIKTEIWGKKALAYPIRKQVEGQYVQMQISIPPSSGPQLEKNLRYLEPILRYLLVNK